MKNQKAKNTNYDKFFRFYLYKLTRRHWAIGLIAVIGLVFFNSSMAKAQGAGSLDMSFGTSGKVKTAFRIDNAAASATVVQSDGKIIAAGSASCSGCGSDFTLARYNIDGSLDVSFGTGGNVFTDFGSNSDILNALALQPDGKIVAAGRTDTVSGNADFAVVRYNPDGSLDLTFDGDGKVITDIGGVDVGNALAIQPDGKIVVAGDYFSGGSRGIAVARYTTTGAPDPAFLTSLTILPADSFATSVVLQMDGKILVGGYITTSGFVDDFVAIRLLSNGLSDSGFGTLGYTQIDFSGNSDRANSIVFDASDNSIILAGSSQNSGGTNSRFAFARLTGAGLPDSGFGTGGKTTTTLGSLSDFAISAALQPDGKIIVGGFSIRASGTDFALVRLQRNGSLDATFGILGQVSTSIHNHADLFAVALQPDGKIIAAGQTYQTVGMAHFAVARYSTAGVLDASFDTDGIVETAFGSTDSAWKVAVQADGKVVVAGYTDESRATPNRDFALTRYNTDGTLDTTFGTGGKVQTDFRNGDDAAFGLVIQPDGKIVAVGTSSSGIKYDFALARYNTNGSLDPGFDSDGKAIIDFLSDNEFLYDVAIQTDGSLIVTGENAILPALGDFVVLSVKSNGTVDTTFGTGGIVQTDFGGNDKSSAVALQPDGKIVVVGDTSLGTFFTTDFAVARYNPDGTLDTTFDTDGKSTVSFGSMLDRAFAVRIGADGKAVIAGFTQNSATDFDFAVARFQNNGALDPSFDGDGRATISFSPTEESATALAIQADGKIVVTGYAYGSPPNFVMARLNNNGSPDRSFDLDGKVTTDFGDADFSRGVAIQPDGKIVVAGTAENNSDTDFAIARYNNSLAPTAANVSVRGRVLTADGQGIQNARLTLTSSSGEIRSAQTTTFGYFGFNDLPAGEIYVLTVSSRRFLFTQPSRVFSLNEDLTDVNFTSESY